MTVTVKPRSALVVPTEVRGRAGIKAADRLEFRVSGGIISIIPKPASATDEHTPEQRKVLDARLAKGLADVKAGRTAGPFDSADDMIVHMKRALRKRATAKKANRSR